MFITDKIWNHLYPAVKDTYEDLKREDFEQGIKNGSYKLFTNNKSSALIASYNTTLRVGLAGGDLESLKEIEKKIVNYAKKRKYKYIDILGRKGWERALEGYNKKAVLLRKEIA
tara:strand:- start:1066 stop:1407 length:342 start_codon:yes stop_codon:yes gene_type:complete